MVSADRSFASETLRDGTANLNEPIYGPNFVRGSFTGAETRSIVDGVMAARCGIATFETDPGGDPWIDSNIGYWFYTGFAGRFLTEARASFQINSSASDYLRNKALWSLGGVVGDDGFDLVVNRTSVASPWTVWVNNVDSGVTVTQNAEADVVVYFSGTDLRYVVTVAAVDILDVTIAATGRPEELDCVTQGTKSRDFSPGGGSPGTGYAYGSVNQISYTLTPLIITTDLPEGFEGTPYDFTVLTDADAGEFSVTEGTFPFGLTIDPDTGEITGTPTTPGVYTFTLTYEETDSGEATEREYSLEVTSDEPPSPSILPAWKATLNAATVCGGDCSDDPTVVACLKTPPDGTGIPPQRIEDATYPQRDGVEHFSDWYEPRILTFDATIGNTTGGCGCEGGARTNAAELMDAWSRSCDDTELVLFTDCPISATPGPGFARTDLATNQALNPSFEIMNLDHWNGYPNDEMQTVTGGWVGTWAGSVTYADGPGADNAGVIYGDVGVDAVLVTEGDPISASIRIKGTTGQDYAIGFLFYDSLGALINDVEGLPQTIDAITWQKLTASVLVPPTATEAVVLVRATAAPPEDSQLLVDGLIVTFTPSDVTYFDGSFADDIDPVTGGIGYEWTGTENDSTSIMFEEVASGGRGLTGPFGVVGRPRVAELTWRRGKKHIADALLRFDSVDHRLYILDEDGTPGSGAQCVNVVGPTGYGITVDTPYPLYDFSVVGSPLVDHYWPLDFTRIVSDDSLPAGTQYATDIVGSTDAFVSGGYLTFTGSVVDQVAPISFGLSWSSVQGPANVQIEPMPGAYTNGMVGWWQSNDGNGLPGAVFGSGSYRVGQGTLGEPEATIRWNGAAVPMNADVQDAFGFTNGLIDQPVLIVLTWTATNLYIYAAHQGSGAGPYLLQTVPVGSLLPSGGAIQVFALGRISNVVSGANHYPTSAEGEDLIEDLLVSDRPFTPPSAVTLPDVGNLCVPFQATFTNSGAGSNVEVYIFRQDGTFVGIGQSSLGSLYSPTSLNTESGTATRFSGTMNASNEILGNPFLLVEPGETLNVFVTADAEICFRPAVISA